MASTEDGTSRAIHSLGFESVLGLVSMESSEYQGSVSPQLIKIGVVARKFEVSVDLLRLYEREGLLIPIKSPKGTRYFTAQDFDWINTLMRLVRDSGLNFAGIRHLLALLPCWAMKHCKIDDSRSCPATAHPVDPCWINHACCQAGRDCYRCEVYRSAPTCTNLRSILQPHPAAANAAAAD